MTDFTLIKTAAEHAIKAKGTLLAEAAQSNYDGLVTPESVLEMACAHEQFKAAYAEFAEKTDWARTWNSPNELGQHIADVIKMRFDNLQTGLEVTRQALESLKAENEALRKDRTDWQAECLRRGFEYVREPDDHYVLADLPEMADLLGMLLGVEVRTKDNDTYEEANSRLNEQIEGLINTIHEQRLTTVHFVCDQMPGQDGCRFIELENPQGESLGAEAGEWEIRPDGLAQLVVTLGDAALRKDEERYRWLLLRSEEIYVLPVGQHGINLPVDDFEAAKDFDGLKSKVDMAIDAAMAKEAGE